MAGFALKTVNKLARRARYIKERQRGKYDKENKLEKQLAKSPRAFKLSRKEQRRQDRNFGNDAVSQKPVLAFRSQAPASAVARVVYVPNPSGHGIQMTMPSGLIAAIGIQPNDIIQFRNGALAGQELLVVALPDATHIMLTDIASYTSESNIYFLALLSSELAQFKSQTV